MLAEHSTKSLSTVLGISERAVQLRAKKEAWPQLNKHVRGGKKRLFMTRMLPSDVRQALTIRDTEEMSLSVSEPSVPLPANIPDSAKEIGLAKFQLLQAWHQAKKSAPWGKVGEASQSFIIAYNSGQLLPLVFQKIGTTTEKTLTSLDRKLKAADNDYLALCDGRGGWKKQGRVKQKKERLSKEAATAFLQCYLQPNRPSVLMAIRASRYILEKQNISDIPGDKTFRRWLKDYEKDHAGIICLARDGEKAYKDRYGSYITRDTSLIEPGQCLVADGKTLNFMILHPDTGKPCRMTLILFYDWGSQSPVGWQIMPSENSISIMAAFRNAVINLGRYPDSVYLDNGRAFKSKVFTETNPDLEELNGIYARAGVAVFHSIAYNGRSKVVERFFLTFQEQCECLIPSFCGDSIDNKPAWMHRNEKFHKAWHKAKTDNWIPTIREASHIIDSYFKWYSENPHMGLGGRKPIDVLTPGFGPGVPQDQLIYDFLWRKEIAPRNCRLRLWGIDYEADFLGNRSTKHKMLVMYDTADLTKVYVYSKEREFLGEAYPVEALHPLARLTGDQLALDEVRNKMKQQRTLAKKTKSQLMELGASAEETLALNALPYNRREPMLINNQNKQSEIEHDTLDDAEVKRLEMIRDDAEQENKVVHLAIPRPELWESDLHHYEWSFSVSFEHGQTLSEEDSAFMTYFEKTSEFKMHYSGRFEGLKELYKTYGNNPQHRAAL